MALRYFEDFETGQVLELGSRTVTREEIIEFAEQFDPQPFHLGEEEAKDTIFGGLIASGWHTGAMLMRMLVDGWLGEAASLGSPGVDELRWRRPVRPGDTLSAKVTIVSMRPSKSKPEIGICECHYEMTNQDGAAVLTMRGIGMLARRGHAP